MQYSYWDLQHLITCPWAVAGGSSMQPTSPGLDPVPSCPLKSFLDVLAPSFLSGQVPANCRPAVGAP